MATMLLSDVECQTQCSGISHGGGKTLKAAPVNLSGVGGPRFGQKSAQATNLYIGGNDNSGERLHGRDHIATDI